MATNYATIPVPNAARVRGVAHGHAWDECRALVNAVKRMAIGPNGETPTVAQIAGLMGMVQSTLDRYCSPPRRDRSTKQRGVPYCVLYALGAMVACPEGVARELWG